MGFMGLNTLTALKEDAGREIDPQEECSRLKTLSLIE